MSPSFFLIHIHEIHGELVFIFMVFIMPLMHIHTAHETNNSHLWLTSCMYYFLAEKFLMYRGMGMGREVENKKSSYLQINFCR